MSIKRKKIKFSINETLDTVVTQITEKLPELKTKWEIHDEGDKPYFSTHVNGVSIEVHEDKVKFNINREGYDSDERVFQNNPKRKKPGKIRIYEMLCRRFDLQDDYKFYKRVLSFIHGHSSVERNKNGIQFTEDKDCGEDF